MRSALLSTNDEGSVLYYGRIMKEEKGKRKREKDGEGEREGEKTKERESE